MFTLANLTKQIVGGLSLTAFPWRRYKLKARGWWRNQDVKSVVNYDVNYVARKRQLIVVSYVAAVLSTPIVYEKIVPG